MFGIRFRFVTIAILLIFCGLLVPAEIDALMSAEKKRGSRSISISPDRYEKLTYETEAEEIPPQEEVEEEMSEEEIVTMETIIAEEIKRIKAKEEKRRIIEGVKEESPDQLRPFVVKEEVVLSRPSKPKAEVELLERHNVLIGERPFLLSLILLALSVIIYYIYKFTPKKPVK